MPVSKSDRDILVPKHRAASQGVPGFVDEEFTGRYEGEDLARLRARRPTPERVSRLEKRVDKLDKDMAVGFAESKTRLDTLLELATKAEAERERRAAADAAAAVAKAAADHAAAVAKAAADAAALDQRRKHTIALIGALAGAAAIVIAALVGVS